MTRQIPLSAFLHQSGAEFSARGVESLPSLAARRLLDRVGVLMLWTLSDDAS